MCLAAGGHRVRLLCMGKHAARRRGRTARLVTGIGLAVVLVGGGATWAATRDGGASASAVTRSTPSATSSTGDSTREAAAATALASCAATAKTGARLADAAQASARDWTIQTQAQKDNESGTLTDTQVAVRWADSNGRSSSDLNGFASAWSSWTSVQHGCDGIVDATKGTPSAEAGAACAAHIGALTQVASSGNVVNNQWATDVVLMAAKTPTDQGSYRQQWLDMVRAAGPALDTYSSAVAALEKAPACTA